MGLVGMNSIVLSETKPPSNAVTVANHKIDDNA